MKTTTLATAKATGERAAKVLLPEPRKTGAVLLEITEECDPPFGCVRWEAWSYGNYSRGASVATKRCVEDAARSLGFHDAGDAWFMQCLPDVYSEAIEAAEALNL